MDDQQTCGKGIAEHAVIPARIGELVASTARVLEVHMKALDMTDPNSRAEHDAYRELATTHRRIAAELATLAERMASYRDLPMGKHDMAQMMSPAPRHAFAGLVKSEEALGEVLKARIEEDHAMLSMMNAS